MTSDLPYHNEADHVFFVQNGGNTLEESCVTGVDMLSLGRAALMKGITVAFEASFIHLGTLPEQLAKATESCRIITDFIAVEVVYTSLDTGEVIEIDEKTA